jgi:hypothetical protein
MVMVEDVLVCDRVYYSRVDLDSERCQNKV